MARDDSVSYRAPETARAMLQAGSHLVASLNDEQRMGDQESRSMPQ